MLVEAQKGSFLIAGDDDVSGAVWFGSGTLQERPKSCRLGGQEEEAALLMRVGV